MRAAEAYHELLDLLKNSNKLHTKEGFVRIIDRTLTYTAFYCCFTFTLPEGCKTVGVKRQFMPSLATNTCQWGNQGFPLACLHLCNPSIVQDGPANNLPLIPTKWWARQLERDVSITKKSWLPYRSKGWPDKNNTITVEKKNTCTSKWRIPRTRLAASRTTANASVAGMKKYESRRITFNRKTSLSNLFQRLEVSSTPSSVGFQCL